MEFTPDLITAIRAATQASQAIEKTRLEFDGSVQSETKDDDTPVTVADRRASGIIRDIIFNEDPGSFILDEEASDSHGIERPDRFWVVDPLDGTREFIKGNGEYVVMIALIEDGRPIMGVMARPSTGEIFCAARGRGAWSITGESRHPLTCCNTLSIKAMRSLVSRSRMLDLVARAHKALGILIVDKCGSAGFKCSRIAIGKADLWLLDPNRVSLWDLCASEILLTEAEGMLTDHEGKPIDYMIEGTKWPRGVIACSSKTLHPEIVRRVEHLLQ